MPPSLASFLPLSLQFTTTLGTRKYRYELGDKELVTKLGNNQADMIKEYARHHYDTSEIVT